MNYQSICLDAIETVLGWDLPDEAFSDALSAQASLMAGFNQEDEVFPD